MRLAESRSQLVARLELLEVEDAEDHQHLQQRGVDQPCCALGQRDSPEQLLHRRRDREVDLGHHPDRCPLKDGERIGTLGDLRDQLDGGGAGADDRHLLTGEVEAVLPRRGVQDRALEVLDPPREVRDVRLGEKAGRGHQVPGGALGSVTGAHSPETRGVVPLGAVDRRLEFHVPFEVVLVRDVMCIPLELGTGGRTVETSSGWARRSTSR